jgi:hypothetical protein
VLGNCRVTNQVDGARNAGMMCWVEGFWLGRCKGKEGKGLETLVIACGHMTKGS